MKSSCDYHSITEAPGLKASSEQVERIVHRYWFAQEFCSGRDVLEVACGTGIGLHLLASTAKSVSAGDIDKENVRIALEISRGAAITVQEIDAHRLPFEEGSFDLVILFEAIYYLQDPGAFVREANRALRPGGILLIGTVNKDWEDFHPSPYSHNYLSAPELSGLLRGTFGSVRLYGAFPTQSDGIRARLVSVLKRAAVKFDLIPGSLAARARLNRFFMGRLVPITERIFDNTASFELPERIPDDTANRDFKILYAIAENSYQPGFAHLMPTT